MARWPIFKKRRRRQSHRKSIMKNVALWLLLIGMPIGGVTHTTFGDKPADEAFAVVELFTSEGCSSCPPADKLLAEIAKDAKENGRRIFLLAYHVDYWNYLGWADPFSSAAYSERQEEYARVLGVDEIYTPQMIVNGKEAFVGSDRTRARKTVDSALSLPAKASVTIRATPDADGSKIEYRVSNTPKDAVLCVAVVESGLVSQVRRGENAGRTLPHTNVVREFVAVALNSSGTGGVSLKTKLSAQNKNKQVIVFIQDRRTLAILGAASVEPS
jgi:hypothetical protein